MRKFAKALCAAVTTLLVAAPAAVGQNQPATVKVGVLGSISEAPMFVALDRGYFAGEKLNVEFVNFAATAQMMSPIATGQLDIGVGAATVGFFNARARGIDIKLVADKGRTSKGNAFNAIVIRKDLVESGRVKSLSDVKGMRIASPSRLSPMEYELDVGLNQKGLTLKDVDIELMRFPDMMTAMANKAIDGALLIEPFITLTEVKKIGVRFMGVDEIYPDFQIAGVIYGPQVTTQRPDVGRRWMVAYIKGIRDFIDGMKVPEKRAEIVATLVKHTRVKNAKLYSRMKMPGFDPDGYLHLKSIADTMEWFVAQKGLKAALKLEEFVDYRFLDYAHEKIGRRGARQTVR